MPHSIKSQRVYHGLSHTREYHIWFGIKGRCSFPSHPNYQKYGGVGITCCDRWLRSFEAFYADMGPSPSLAHSVDRIDTYKGYSPENCRWLLKADQSRNARTNRRITVGGLTKTAAEWSREYGISANTILKRLDRGWDDISAVSLLPWDSIRKQPKVEAVEVEPERQYTPILERRQRFIDLTDHKYGRLKVIECLGRCGKHTFWRCRCECGKEHVASTNKLRSSEVSSCGCYGNEVSGARWRTHGLTKTTEYIIWYGMIQRCHNSKCPTYKKWGGRGVIVCQQWRDSFEVFLKDVGSRPSHLYTLDRINNDGNYEPGNVRWATRREQAGNTKRTLRLTYQGETKSMAEWSRKTNIKVATLWTRIKLHGWTVERALETPVYHRP